MRDAVVFNSTNFLGFHDIRVNVIRIPQVMGRIREAQQIWDQLASEPLDLANFLTSEDAVFLSHIKRKQLLSSIVQVALWDRHLNAHGRPEYLVGVVNGDSAMRVALGEQSFFELVAQSPALNNNTMPLPSLKLMSGDLPLLAGVQLEEHAVYQRQANDTYERVKMDVRDVEKMVLSLVQGEGVSRVTVVGPGQCSWSQRLDLVSSVEAKESIETDPLLNWFWPQVTSDRVIAAAN